MRERRIHNAETGEVWAEIAPFSIADVQGRASLEERWPPEKRSSRLIVPAGELDTQESDSEIERQFGAWSERGRTALEIGLRTLIDTCGEKHIEPLVWPARGTLVSDIPGILSVARKHETLGVFLDPELLFPSGDRFGRAEFGERLLEVVPMPCIRALCFGADDPKGKDIGDLLPFAALARLAKARDKPVVIWSDPPEDAAAVLGLC